MMSELVMQPGAPPPLPARACPPGTSAPVPVAPARSGQGYSYSYTIYIHSRLIPRPLSRRLWRCRCTVLVLVVGKPGVSVTDERCSRPLCLTRVTFFLYVFFCARAAAPNTKNREEVPNLNDAQNQTTNRRPSIHYIHSIY